MDMLADGLQNFGESPVGEPCFERPRGRGWIGPWLKDISSGRHWYWHH